MLNLLFLLVHSGLALHYSLVIVDAAPKFQESRRSTRVPLEVSIEVSGVIGTVKGTTIVVNLHGALLHTVNPVPSGSRIRVVVYLTGKSSMARVVYVSPDEPLNCGIELDKPQNIWGISLVPDDWEESAEIATH